MMRIINILCMGLVALGFTATPVNAQFFYSNGGPVYLDVDSTRVLIRIDQVERAVGSEELVLSIGRLEEYLDDPNVYDGFMAFSLTTSDGYFAFLDSLDTLSGIDLVEPYYLNDVDSAFLVGTSFVVGFHDTISQVAIDSMNSANGVDMGYELPNMSNIYLLHNSSASGYRGLEIANLYYESDLAYLGHPDFMLRPVLFDYEVHDYYSEYQVHNQIVTNWFGDHTVWNFAGLTEPMVVAVFDNGIDVHADLPAERVLSGYDYADHDSDPTPPTWKNHGMNCAGIIAASHTTDSVSGLDSESGVFSIAPHTRILPVKIFVDDPEKTPGISSADLALAFIDAALADGADVISCSWGMVTEEEEDIAVVNLGIKAAKLGGRNGLGTPIIFASGNSPDPASHRVAWPANNEHTFAVGASDVLDVRWYYSQFGWNADGTEIAIDVLAPSGNLWMYGDVWSLDRMGGYGKNPHDTSDCLPEANNENYWCHFGGTSAATAVVSGIAALILSFDSTLTADQVYDVLRYSAVSEWEWGSLEEVPHYEYGYGRADAYRAILSLARGDMNADGVITMADITILIDQVYYGGDGGFPDERLGNCNCSAGGSINLADITKLIDHVYVSKEPLPLPCFVYEYPNQQ